MPVSQPCISVNRLPRNRLAQFYQSEAVIKTLFARHRRKPQSLPTEMGRSLPGLLRTPADLQVVQHPTVMRPHQNGWLTSSSAQLRFQPTLDIKWLAASTKLTIPARDFSCCDTLLGTLSKVRFMSVSFPEHEPTQDERDDDARKYRAFPHVVVALDSASSPFGQTENPGVGGSIPPQSTSRSSPHEVATIGIVRASVCASTCGSFSNSEEQK